MERRAGGRHCAQCNKQVHDLSSVTEARARAIALLFGSSGMCGRLRADAFGEAIWRKEPTPLRDGRARLLAAAVTLAPLGCGGGASPAHETATLPTPPPPSPEDSAPPPESSALATIDSGGEGIPDRDDMCPNEPGTLENHGCPPRFVGIIATGDIKILEQPHFAVQAKTLLPSNFPILDEVAAVLKQNPDIKLVHVIGHTDRTEGSPDKLSLARAKAVADYLVKAGIDASRLTIEGKGNAFPVDTNDTKTGREHNRRVEFIIDQGPPTNIP